jgi:hypothetical protein
MTSSPSSLVVTHHVAYTLYNILIKHTTVIGITVLKSINGQILQVDEATARKVCSELSSNSMTDVLYHDMEGVFGESVQWR